MCLQVASGPFPCGASALAEQNFFYASHSISNRRGALDDKANIVVCGRFHLGLALSYKLKSLLHTLKPNLPHVTRLVETDGFVVPDSLEVRIRLAVCLTTVEKQRKNSANIELWATG